MVEDPKPDGLHAVLRRISDSLLGLAQSRLQLFALEVQSEKLRLLDILLWFSFGAVLGSVGLLLGTMALGIVVWEIAGIAGLLVMMGVFLGASIIVFWRLRGWLRRGPTPFADTIAEFRKDRSCFHKQD